MNIGIVIIETGDEDGVWLETIKLLEIFASKGFSSFLLTGKDHGGQSFYQGQFRSKSFEVPIEVDERFTPRMGVAQKIYEEAFEKFERDPGLKKQVNDSQEQEMQQRLNHCVSELEEKLLSWVQKKKIDFIISENANAIPMHVPLGVAIRNLTKIGKIKALFHNHDFPWERGDKYLGTPYQCIKHAVEECFPGKASEVSHIVINDYNLRKLKERLGLESVKLPNVMDFNGQPFAQIDDYNKNMFKDLGIPSEALVLGQVTRIVRRKNIEAAVDLLKKLNELRKDKKTVLVITGAESIGDKTGYVEELKDLIKVKELDDQVYWVNHRVHPKRGEVDGEKIYSLSDFYAHLKTRGLMTYPSTYEGFGNAFVEATLAKVLIVPNNYKPVYWEEIGRHGFHTIQFEDGKISDQTVEKTNDWLERIKAQDPKIKNLVEENYEIGLRELSYEVAEKVIDKAIEKLK